MLNQVYPSKASGGLLFVGNYPHRRTTDKEFLDYCFNERQVFTVMELTDSRWVCRAIQETEDSAMRYMTDNNRYLIHPVAA